MRRPHLFLALAALIGVLPGCSPVAASSPPAAPVLVRDSNLVLLAGKFRVANRAPVNIVQLGDSHTAADLFTGELRRLLQAKYGDGGIGFVAATPVPGTRYDNVILNTASRQWALVSARNQHSEQFPLGGYLALPLTATPSVRLQARESSAQRYRISTLYQAQQNSSLAQHDSLNQRGSVMLAASGGQWRFSPVINNVVLPVDMTLTAQPGTVLGGWYIQGQKNAGVTLSALGINGARLDVQDKWQAGWQDNLKALRPDLVMLAYGTNEAFDNTLDVAQYQAHLSRTVTQLRQQLPRAVIVLIGPPDSIKQRGAKGCAARRPQMLPQVVQIQKQVAQQARVLFWDWQAFMGGECAIVGWQAQGLARADLVHLTAEGYRRSASGLYEYLRGQLGLR